MRFFVVRIAVIVRVRCGERVVDSMVLARPVLLERCNEEVDGLVV